MYEIIKNHETNETLKVSNVKRTDDGMLVGKYVFGTRFYNKYGHAVRKASEKGGRTLLELRPGWCIVSDDDTQPQPQPQPESQPQPEPEPQPEPQPVPQPQPQPQPTFNAGGLEGGLAAVFAPIFAEVSKKIEADVRASVASEMAELKALAKSQARKIKIELPDGETTEVTGATIPEFDDIVQDVMEGYNVYMYGPAGAGKSYTAKQIAAALKLPFYETNQLEFAHEVIGYGDASGRFVETPFYKAVTEGGLFFFDEWDRSTPQVTTVVNTVLANRRFTFPVVGNVDAHPNFRVIAAGNTAMTGADMEYTAAQLIDASSRDRFVMYEIPYSKDVELPIHAAGDESLYEFMDALRKAAKETGIQLLASPRSTEYLKRRENNKVGALKRRLFYQINQDDIKNLYEKMSVRNDWTRAMKQFFNV